MNEKQKKVVKCRLSNRDGNAYAIMGRVAEALKKAGVSKDEIIEYTKKATSGDYNNLLKVSMSTLDHHGVEWS